MARHKRGAMALAHFERDLLTARVLIPRS